MMKVFISWSGVRSKAVAEAIRDILPHVMNAVEPWMSGADIEKGAKWGADIESELGSADFGILCVTPGNRLSPWLLYEAGALSRSATRERVCPLLIDLRPSEIVGPLTLFQHATTEKQELFQLFQSINNHLGDAHRSDVQLLEAFDVWWPKIEGRLQNLPDETPVINPTRPQGEILNEILALVRRTNRDQVARLALIGPLPDPSDIFTVTAFLARMRDLDLASVTSVFTSMPPPPEEPHTYRITTRSGITVDFTPGKGQLGVILFTILKAVDEAVRRQNSARQ